MTRGKNTKTTEETDENAEHQQTQESPVYQVGLVDVDDYDKQKYSPPPEVEMPKDWPLGRCYRLNPDKGRFSQADRVNIHLLAAVGTFGEPFVPVTIAPEYDKCPWAQLPTIDSVSIKAGREIHKDYVWFGDLACVESLEITVCTSDGKTFSSPVCVAVKPESHDDESDTHDDYEHFYCDTYVTREAETRFAADHLFFLLGGVYYPEDDSETYDRETEDYDRKLREFWIGTIGPDEPLRQGLMDCLAAVKGRWRSVMIKADGSVAIKFENGKTKKILSPAA